MNFYKITNARAPSQANCILNPWEWGKGIASLLSFLGDSNICKGLRNTNGAYWILKTGEGF